MSTAPNLTVAQWEVMYAAQRDRITELEADRDRLREALTNLLNYWRISGHDCDDRNNCPIFAARKALELSK